MGSWLQRFDHCFPCNQLTPRPSGEDWNWCNVIGAKIEISSCAIKVAWSHCSLLSMIVLSFWGKLIGCWSCWLRHPLWLRTSHKSLVPERQPTSLCELPIHNCTTHYQKDGNLNDAIPPDRRKSEDRSETTTGCRGIRPPTDNPRAPSRAKGKPETSSSSHARSPSTAQSARTHVRYNCDMRGSTKELSAESSSTHHLPSYQKGGSEPVSKTNCQSSSRAEIPRHPAAQEGYHLKEHSHSCNLPAKPESTWDRSESSSSPAPRPTTRKPSGSHSATLGRSTSTNACAIATCKSGNLAASSFALLYTLKSSRYSPCCALATTTFFASASTLPLKVARTRVSPTNRWGSWCAFTHRTMQVPHVLLSTVLLWSVQRSWCSAGRLDNLCSSGSFNKLVATRTTARLSQKTVTRLKEERATASARISAR